MIKALPSKEDKMIWNFFKLIIAMLQFLFQGKNTLPQTKTAFKALTGSIIPNTYELTEKQAPLYAIGALDLHTSEYLICTLDHYVSLKLILKNFNIYLANATAEMLNIAARQLISTGGNEKPINPAVPTEQGIFAALEATDRCRTIILLEQLKVDLTSLPVPFRHNPGIVLAMVSIITVLATAGYYSEWSGYGSTRLAPPGKRKIEHLPTGWKQIGYPGPSKGYHALRGYLI
jgi:hypothetical protein